MRHVDQPRAFHSITPKATGRQSERKFPKPTLENIATDTWNCADDVSFMKPPLILPNCQRRRCNLEWRIASTFIANIPLCELCIY
ncbi:hypothetical protein EAG_13735 [Camponotus floridanus]|uniref:Uncharacterized protein n=1 Tax=Camponotus floridanus TaxID=104421 RepID=E2AJU0_CAMFO|nr:hypothetical protein EAG_13735 [Camponotus floridanus]